MLLVILTAKKLLEHFFKKNFENHTEFSVEEVIKRKDDNLDVKWKDYDNSFNSWIDKRYLYIRLVIFQSHITRAKA